MAADKDAISICLSRVYSYYSSIGGYDFQKPMSIIYILQFSYAMLSAPVVSLLGYTALYKFVTMLIMFVITHFYDMGDGVTRYPAVYFSRVRSHWCIKNS